jgi:hypothetical protein
MPTIDPYTAPELSAALENHLDNCLARDGAMLIRQASDVWWHGIEAVELGPVGEQFFFLTTTTKQRFRVTVTEA